jgi:hypothetical protein
MFFHVLRSIGHLLFRSAVVGVPCGHIAMATQQLLENTSLPLANASALLLQGGLDHEVDWIDKLAAILF